MTDKKAKVLQGKATSRGRYPHARRAGDYIFISGTSARQADNTIIGAQEVDAMGTYDLDIRVQTRAVLDNIADILARFAVSGINVGLFCSTPAVPLSRNMHRKQAMQMLLTGEFIDAQTAKQFGLVNEVVPPEELDAAITSLSQKIAGKSPLTVSLGKKMFYRQATMDLSAAYEYAGERMTCNMDSEDAREGIDAFIENAGWSGRAGSRSKTLTLVLILCNT